MFFKAFEIERRSFSTDYMEWTFRSSARLRSAMIVNESDEARPRHRDEQPDQDPGQVDKRVCEMIVKALFSDTERQTVGSFDSERAGRSRRARSRESSAGPAGQRTEPDRTEVKGNPTSSKEARRAT